MSQRNKNLLKKRFYKLRDQRDEILTSDMSPNERHRKAEAIQRQINAIAKKYEAS